MLTFNGLTYPVMAYSSSTDYLDDVIVTTDTIQSVSTAVELTVSNFEPVCGTIEIFIATSILGLRTGTNVRSQVYFALQLTKYTPESTFLTRIQFDRVLTVAPI